MPSARLSLPRPPADAAGLVGALSQQDGLSPVESRTVISLIAGAHVLAMWGLLQVDAVRDAVREVAPLIVDIVAPPKPEQLPPPPPPPPAPTLRTPKPVIEKPLIAAPQAAPAPAETFTTPAPPPEPAPVVVATPAPPAPPALPAPPPPAPKVVSASAVAYLVPPTGEMPRLSRRAREQGTVWLHVVVDTQGLPSQIRVSKSSGYTRLDDHAVEAMRKARFKPYSQDGVAIEIQVTTPIEYSLDN